MPIDLKKILSKKLEPRMGGPVFEFKTVGDQLVFRFEGRRVVKTKRGDDSDLIDCHILGGERFDAKAKKNVPAKKGAAVFFLSATHRRIFDTEKPVRGDVIHTQLAEVVPSQNNMKIFGFEFIERAPSADRSGDDNIPEFSAP